MRSHSTTACALCGEKEGEQMLKWLPSISAWGQIQTRLVASAGKKTAVYCCFCGETALQAGSAWLPVNYLVLFQVGGKVFWAPMTWLCMKWPVGSWYDNCQYKDCYRPVPQQRFRNLGRTSSNPLKVTGCLLVSTQIAIPDQLASSQRFSPTYPIYRLLYHMLPLIAMQLGVRAKTQ